jgi:hypothetical protein
LDALITKPEVAVVGDLRFRAISPSNIVEGVAVGDKHPAFSALDFAVLFNGGDIFASMFA